MHHRRMAATEDKVAKAVAYYRKLLDRLPQSPESLSQAPSSQLHVIVEKAGAKRRSPALLEQLEAAFDEAEIMTFPSLTDPFLKPTDRLCMLDARQPIENLASRRELFPRRRSFKVLSGLVAINSMSSTNAACPISGSRQSSTAVGASTSSAKEQNSTNWSLSS